MRIVEDIKTMIFHIRRYQPLIFTVAITALAATALCSKGMLGKVGRSLPHPWMHSFMGIFFCLFSLFKLFNVKGFKEGFEKYDLITSKLPIYGYVYPFIELGLGLGYLSYYKPMVTYTLTFLFMSTGAASVIRAMKKGLDVKCACLGTVLSVPLSSVSLLEDVFMGLMAFYLIIAR